LRAAQALLSAVERVFARPKGPFQRIARRGIVFNFTRSSVTIAHGAALRPVREMTDSRRADWR